MTDINKSAVAKELVKYLRKFGCLIPCDSIWLASLCHVGRLCHALSFDICVLHFFLHMMFEGVYLENRSGNIHPDFS